LEAVLRIVRATEGEPEASRDGFTAVLRTASKPAA